jgi:glutamine synthetase
LDEQRWEKIQALKEDLARDDVDKASIFHRIRTAAAARDFPAVSSLQIEMTRKMKELTDLYRLYRQNLAPA